MAVFAVLVVLQSLWLRNAAILQHQENELELKQLVDEVALAVNGLGHNYFHHEDSLLMTNISVDTLEQTIQTVLDSNQIDLPTYFSIYKETDSTIFITNKEQYKSDLLQSEIKSCLSCIVSFSMVSPEEGKRGPDESEEDFAKRLNKVSTFQYFSPVRNLVKEERLWLTLHQPFSFSTALRSMAALFITNIVLLLILIFLFNHLLKLLSNYRKISQLKEDFFNNMTHEFKTPLSSIRLASRVLRKNPTSEKATIYHDVIERESKTLELQIDKLLELSLLDNQEIELEKASTDLHQLIQEIPKRLQPLLDKHQGEIIFELQAEQPILNLDQHHFSNSLCNLVENSLKYSDQSVMIWIKNFCKKWFDCYFSSR